MRLQPDVGADRGARGRRSGARRPPRRGRTGCPGVWPGVQTARSGRPASGTRSPSPRSRSGSAMARNVFMASGGTTSWADNHLRQAAPSQPLLVLPAAIAGGPHACGQRVGLRRVHRHPCPRRLAQARREPVVVGVDVGDHHPADVAQRRADRLGQALDERGPCLVDVPTGIEHEHPAARLDEVRERVSATGSAGSAPERTTAPGAPPRSGAGDPRATRSVAALP